MSLLHSSLLGVGRGMGSVGSGVTDSWDGDPASIPVTGMDMTATAWCNSHQGFMWKLDPTYWVYGCNTPSVAPIPETKDVLGAGTPGLPIGYDPATGVIRDNPSGITTLPLQTSGDVIQQILRQRDIDAAAAAQKAADDAAAAQGSWTCQYLGLGCGGASMTTLLVVGGIAAAFIAVAVIKK